MSDPKPWFTIQEKGFVWGMRFLIGVYRLLGRWVFAVLLYPVIGYYMLFNATARKSSKDYLARLNAIDETCRVKPTPWSTCLHFGHFAESILDRTAAWTGVLTLQDLVFEHREDLTRPLGRGQGVLLVGSHLGCLEVCRAFARLKQDIRLNVLIHSKNAQRMNALLQPLNREHQLELMEVSEISPATAITLNKKIQQGEVVVVVGDRVPVGESSNTIRADFMGAAARFPQGPWVLAHLLKCPVLTLFCIKREGKYHIYCEPFAERIHLPRAVRQEKMAREVQRFAARLEHYCKIAPLEWYNFFPYWQDTGSHTRKQAPPEGAREVSSE